MSNGERIIVKLDPDYNPTGKPMPDTLLKQMKADPDFAKLSEEEQKQVISKVENMVKEVEDVDKYGTLKEKLIKVVALKNYYDNKNAIPFIKLVNNIPNKGHTFEGEYCNNIFGKRLLKNILFLLEGSQVNVGQCILKLLAIDEADKIHEIVESDLLPFNDYFEIADIKAPISGKIFSLCQMRSNYGVKVNWNDDLFIVSSVADDTRSAAIKWYKETTGKEPQYKTPEDKQEEAAAKKANVDSFLSKWDL